MTDTKSSSSSSSSSTTATSSTTTVSTHGAGHFLAAKAGMNYVDKEKVAKVVEEMSRGSKYYTNAQQRDERLYQKITQMKEIKINSSDLQQYQRFMDNYRIKIESERILSRIWIVIDMDAFFANVEERDNPSLAGKPFAVGGMGMISTASYEARKYGIRSAQPGFIAKELCPQLIFVSPDFSKYTAASEEVRQILQQYDPSFSSMSLDEAYLDITDYCIQHGIITDERENLEEEHEDNYPTRTLLQNSTPSLISTNSPYRSFPNRRIEHIPTPAEQLKIAELVQEIRQKVKEHTRGLTCSAGIAPNPLLAKIFSNDHKPDGQTMVPFNREDIIQYMEPLPVRSLPGVGKVTERILIEMGFLTCKDILMNSGKLRFYFNERMSTWLVRSALGIASTDDEQHQDTNSDELSRKSISQERTFHDCDNIGILEKKCEELANSIEKSMIEENIVGSTISIKCKLYTFEIIQKSITLRKPTNNGLIIGNTAKQLFHSIKQPLKLRLLGVRVSSLQKINTQPTCLDTFLQSKSTSTKRNTDDNKENNNTDNDEVIFLSEAHNSTDTETMVPSKVTKTTPLTNKRKGIEKFFGLPNINTSLVSSQPIADSTNIDNINHPDNEIILDDDDDEINFIEIKPKLSNTSAVLSGEINTNPHTLSINLIGHNKGGNDEGTLYDYFKKRKLEPPSLSSETLVPSTNWNPTSSTLPINPLSKRTSIIDLTYSQPSQE